MNRMYGIFTRMIRFKKRRSKNRSPQALNAEELLNSNLVGLWSDRPEVEDSLSFARQLRREAEHARGRILK